MEIEIVKILEPHTFKKADGLESQVHNVEAKDGTKYQSFNPVPLGIGEYNVTPNANPKYPSRIATVKKAGAFVPKPVNNRVVALQCAVQLCVADKIGSQHTLELAKKFTDFLEGK